MTTMTTVCQCAVQITNYYAWFIAFGIVTNDSIGLIILNTLIVLEKETDGMHGRLFIFDSLVALALDCSLKTDLPRLMKNVYIHRIAETSSLLDIAKTLNL